MAVDQGAKTPTATGGGQAGSVMGPWHLRRGADILAVAPQRQLACRETQRETQRDTQRETQRHRDTPFLREREREGVRETK